MYKKHLLELGIPASIKGFEYLNYAIENEGTKNTMAIYKEIAENFHANPDTVRQAMKHAIACTGENIMVSRFIAKYKILWGKGAI